jgi:hypothetical protein
MKKRRGCCRGLFKDALTSFQSLFSITYNHEGTLMGGINLPGLSSNVIHVLSVPSLLRVGWLHKPPSTPHPHFFNQHNNTSLALCTTHVQCGDVNGNWRFDWLGNAENLDVPDIIQWGRGDRTGEWVDMK